ncbi:zinc finger and BTB domain-containing protein 16 isoform X2 [Denticeps clupeoides]|uniref:zinc finger and BTB domain-containing protein 16 isoform X2 n=1 Tax=Denticeps clupeoides TaxID=299321 RepID=UPI0010A33474|nr:zinc finger and BTB domain-containing protein 32 isoform X2 [Denticeps clupeoides]
MVRVQNPSHSSLLRWANKLRLTGTLCDTLVVVEGQVFQAHGLVLACASRKLEQSLVAERSSDLPHRCTLSDLSPRTFQQVLEYVYTGAVEVPRGELRELLTAAQVLEMDHLVKQCQVLLKDEEVTTCPSPFRGSRTHDSDSESFGPKETATCNLLLKKPRPHPPSAEAQPSRESVITGSAPEGLCSASRGQKVQWPSQAASRKFLLNCGELMAIQPIHPPHQVVPYPYPCPSPVYPFSYHPLSPQLHSTLVGYTGLLHPYQHFLQAGSRLLGHDRKQGMLGKCHPSHTTLTGSEQEEVERKQRPCEEKTLRCHSCSKACAPPSSSSASSLAGTACKSCGRSVRDRRSHRRSLTGEKPYQCKHCSKRFSLKHQLDTHHRVHTGEKPFECRLCGQRSRDYSAMIKHLRTHGGATPYRCTACTEFCNSLTSMQKHLKTHPVEDFAPDWSISQTYLYTCHA